MPGPGKFRETPGDSPGLGAEACVLYANGGYSMNTNAVAALLLVTLPMYSTLASDRVSARAATQSASVAPAPTKSLYERLGGTYPIAVVVDDFIERLLVNDTLNA